MSPAPHGQVFRDPFGLIVDSRGSKRPVDHLTRHRMILRIADGGVNMPAYAANLTPAQTDALVAFLKTRKSDSP